MKKHAPRISLIRARAMRSEPTDAERKLWWALRRQLPLEHFRRQVPIGPYIVDFACHAAKLVVELDGSQHADQVEYDERRDRFLAAEGYRVLRFGNVDALQGTDDVIATIAGTLEERRASRGKS
jgi:very-short-patch-repair endonuclease